jgi:creatinine amidohydrolase
VGALEAHGPHLPLDTDVRIALAMAREGARRLAATGRGVLVLPPLVYAPAPFAAGFPGTVSIRPSTLAALVRDIAGSLGARGIPLLVLANAHLDPAHVGVLKEAAAERGGEGSAADGRLRIVFPDVTRRRWAERLTDEFRSGACHAGRYETSIVMAVDPGAVREDVRVGLEPVLHSLTEAIREGKERFEEVGGRRAYFGDPAAATAAEGRRTIEILGEILEEAVREAEGPSP